MNLQPLKNAVATVLSFFKEHAVAVTCVGAIIAFLIWGINWWARVEAAIDDVDTLNKKAESLQTLQESDVVITTKLDNIAAKLDLMNGIDGRVSVNEQVIKSAKVPDIPTHLDRLTKAIEDAELSKLPERLTAFEKELEAVSEEIPKLARKETSEAELRRVFDRLDTIQREIERLRRHTGLALLDSRFEAAAIAVKSRKEGREETNFIVYYSSVNGIIRAGQLGHLTKEGGEEVAKAVAALRSRDEMAFFNEEPFSKLLVPNAKSKLILDYSVAVVGEPGQEDGLHRFLDIFKLRVIPDPSKDRRVAEGPWTLSEFIGFVNSPEFYIGELQELD